MLANAFDYRDADMAVIADAIRRGRARVAALASEPALLPEVAAAAALDEMRQQAVAWAVVRESERYRRNSPSGTCFGSGNRHWIGGDARRLGYSGLSFDGSLRLNFPVAQHWATLRAGGARGSRRRWYRTWPCWSRKR